MISPAAPLLSRACFLNQCPSLLESSCSFTLGAPPASYRGRRIFGLFLSSELTRRTPVETLHRDGQVSGLSCSGLQQRLCPRSLRLLLSLSLMMVAAFTRLVSLKIAAAPPPITMKWLKWKLALTHVDFIIKPITWPENISIYPLPWPLPPTGLDPHALRQAANELIRV